MTTHVDMTPNHVVDSDGRSEADLGPWYSPLTELLVAPLGRPASWREVNLRTLSPFTRALLAIDGTVTKFIEAYTMEPIDVLRLSQEIRRMEEDHFWLEAAAGTEVVARQVVLRGRYRRTVYAFAPSLIVLERLPAEAQAGLHVDGTSLGRIMIDGRMETRREILWYGQEEATDLPPRILELTGSVFISRTYRVIMRGRPVMLISEKFPANFDTDLLPAAD